ncbi:helix-turn-helix domain-containing protein [Agromyces seonyuensis]|uniref:Helix-turn-helix domain-containing protein n=1 Tax=Agromyces seonyuensis TaxID=2662446 RepID=A0A6I4P0J7_9MICO|nr:helix-turn-helix domain-containing protein [Agromyces seonyuensis]
MGIAAAPSETQPKPLWRDAVGAVLRRTRLAQGRILADVARSAGVSTQYLSEVERGRKEASSEILGAVADALGLGLDELAADVAAILARARVDAEHRMLVLGRQGRPVVPLRPAGPHRPVLVDLDGDAEDERGDARTGILELDASPIDARPGAVSDPRDLLLLAA